MHGMRGEEEEENRNKATDDGGSEEVTAPKGSKLFRMVGRRCCKVWRRRRVQDAAGE